MRYDRVGAAAVNVGDLRQSSRRTPPSCTFVVTFVYAVHSESRLGH